jgi:hypothetical protein
MFSDIILAASDEIIKTRSSGTLRLLKSSWTRWVSVVAKEMNITVDYKYNNWHIIERRLQSEKLSSITPSLSSDVTISTQSSSNSFILNKSKKSTLGVPLSEDDKTTVLETYDRLESSQMWCLSSQRCVEKVMRDFCESCIYLQ